LLRTSLLNTTAESVVYCNINQLKEDIIMSEKTVQVNRMTLKDRVAIPLEAYFPASHGAILRDYKPWMEYVNDEETGKSKPTGNQLGMSAVVVSPYMGFEHITVKMAGDEGKQFTYPDIITSYDTKNYIFVTFENFVGGSYISNNVTHYTGTATKIMLVEAEATKSKQTVATAAPQPIARPK
jgi:hypothetical protein